MKRNRYYHHPLRGFVNEFVLAVATTNSSAKDYESRGFERVSRRWALKWAAYRPEGADKAYVRLERDGEPVYRLLA